MVMSGSTLACEVAPLEELRQVVDDPEKAVEALPEGERTAYREAQESVVEARRKAETHEGLLQIN
jgi:hypothetical protein